MTTAMSTAAAPSSIWCAELELGQPLPVALQSPAGASASAARVLLRFHGEPLAYVDAPISDGRVSVNTLLSSMAASARDRLAGHLAADGLDGLSTPGPNGWPCAIENDRPTVSVVVCTRDRGPVLGQCLDQLAALSYPALEMVIVDNASSDETTARVFDEKVGTDPRFRYVREPVPGLSRARNRGLAQVSSDIIAYTDDDVRVDARWVDGLVRGFARRPDVACVTGLVSTAALDTPAELYFDNKVSWSESCEPRVFDLSTPTDDPLYPYAPGVFGTGAAMAFRTETLRAMGGFDEALGAGTRTAGGEDLDIFVRVLLAGHALAYEPSALVWHHHRSDLPGLRRQMFGYGSGLSAYVTKHLLQPGSRRALMSRIPKGVTHLTRIARGSQRVQAPAELPTRALLLRELAGLASGPFLYVAARRQLAARPALAVGAGG